jgi:hypothetical protein
MLSSLVLLGEGTARIMHTESGSEGGSVLFSRSLPTTIQQLDNADISTCTNVTGLQSDDSDLSVGSLSVSEQTSTESHSWRSTLSVLSPSLDPDSTSFHEFVNSTLSTSTASSTSCTTVVE